MSYLETLFALREKRILITGSTRGLGFTFAKGFAKAGAAVIINGTTNHGVKDAMENIRDAGGVAEGAAFDVTDYEAVESAVASLLNGGRIDVLVNNAGIQRREPLIDMSHDNWKKVVDTNLSSVFAVSQIVARSMIKNGKGKILNISSLNSIGARPTIANYCAAKAGLNALTRSMATEWGPYNIQANALVPGYFITDLTRPLADDKDFDSWVKSEVPLGRWGNPDELLGAVFYLTSGASDYVNGHILVVDGGWTACL